MSPITLIGTGLASYTVARELRKLDKESPLRIITQDDGHFYSKPMLSNAFAQNKTPESLLITPVTKMAEQLNAEIITQTPVTQIVPDQHLVSAGEKNFEYSQLVLAYGAEQIRIPLEGNAADKVISVNDLNDYAQFRTALENAKQVVVMGAGLIGCEFANDLQPAGFSVSLVDIAPNALGRLVPKQVAQAVQQGLQELGVTLHFEKGVKSVDAADKGYRLTLTDGTVLEADVVLSAIGLRPRLALAQAAGLSVNRGIVVDRYLKTSADDIYALGDCAEVEGLVLPFVMPLMSAGRALAKTLAGQQTAVTYPAMPVVVKTPACPMVVSPPAIGLEGEWQIEADEKDVKALFYTKEQKLAGFVLTGAKIAEKNALTKELPPVLA
ncbi:Nitric oxide reductase [Beggiatoa sp. PS]|nr:Nitric oxide reductase [Beggiatoa sp. PS]